MSSVNGVLYCPAVIIRMKEYADLIQMQMHSSKLPQAVTLRLQQWASSDVVSTLVMFFAVSFASQATPLAFSLLELCVAWQLCQQNK